MKFISIPHHAEKYRQGQLRQAIRPMLDPPELGEFIALTDTKSRRGKPITLMTTTAKIVIACRIRPTGEIHVNGQPLNTRQALSMAYSEGFDSFDEFHAAMRKRYGSHEEFTLVRW